MLTRKHFEQLAENLRQQYPGDPPDSQAADQWERDVKAVADVLEDTNERFDRARFLKAAGVE